MSKLSNTSMESQCSEDPEEMAEALKMGRLTEDVLLFKSHLMICPRCHQVYEETIEFVDAIRAAAEHLESGRAAEAG